MNRYTVVALCITAALLTAACSSAFCADSDDETQKTEMTEAQKKEEEERKRAEEARKRAEEARRREEEGRTRLLRAYKKEFAFLENEKASLVKRLKEIEDESIQRKNRLEKEVKQLEEKLLKVRKESAERETLLREKEEENGSIEEIENTVRSTLSQAMVTLEQHGIQEFSFGKADESGEKDAEHISNMFKEVRYVFAQAVSVLESLSSIRKEKGKYYLHDGSETEGTIIRVGNIASIGVSDKGSGTLAPAGNGKLKLWNPETAHAAEKLNDSLSHPLLPLYVYKSLEKGVEQEQDKTAVEVIESGGIIAWVIVILGGIGLLMLIGRTLILWWSATNTNRLVQKIGPMVRENLYDRALEICKKAKGTASKVLASTIRHIDAPEAQLEDVIAESILHETPPLDRFESSIKVFAAVAPLLGLLGTVTGMISTFDVITVYGTGDPKLLSGGISEALITTQLGLTVAIPLLILGSLLSGWSESIKGGMENAALRITNISKGFHSPEWKFPLQNEEGAEQDAGIPGDVGPEQHDETDDERGFVASGSRENE